MIGFVGAACGMPISYVLPPLIYLASHRPDAEKQPQQLLSELGVCAGATLHVICTRRTMRLRTSDSLAAAHTTNGVAAAAVKPRAPSAAQAAQVTQEATAAAAASRAMRSLEAVVPAATPRSLRHGLGSTAPGRALGLGSRSRGGSEARH